MPVQFTTLFLDRPLVLKMGELALAGGLGGLTSGSPNALLWASELVVGVVIPVVLWWWPGWRRDSFIQWLAPLLVLVGVGLNRFAATLFAQQLITTTLEFVVYTPHILEWLSTVGILAGATLGWYIGVRYLVAEK